MDENEVSLVAIARALKTGNQYLIDAIKDILEGKVEGNGVIVKREDLVYLTSFKCQNFTTVGSTCFEHGQQGACCNSCWVRRWAERLLNPMDEKEEENSNVDCLEGFRCPECGSYGPYRIAADAWFRVYDSGTDYHTDVEWNDDSACICMACVFNGTIRAFKERK